MPDEGPEDQRPESDDSTTGPDDSTRGPGAPAAESGDGRPSLADRRDLKTVYQPAEDSRLLTDAAVAAVDADDLVLEVGTGSGSVADRIASETGARVVGVDVNPEACRQTRERGVPVVQGNLVHPFADRSVDVVCCNPPYLPTPPEQEWDDPMEAALSGGESGRAVVDPLLATVGRVLRPDGFVLLLVSTLTDLEAVRDEAAANGLAVEPVAEESFPFERLVVFRLSR